MIINADHDNSASTRLSGVVRLLPNTLPPWLLFIIIIVILKMIRIKMIIKIIKIKMIIKIVKIFKIRIIE